MRLLRWAMLLSLIGGPALAAQCAPEKLVHITVREVTPGVDPNSFNAQPRNYYRVGVGKARSEEADDPSQHIHQVLVIAEPNIWITNLADGTGIHGMDSGPTFDTHLPIFVGDAVSPRITDLEFGCEVEFIRRNAPSPARLEQVGGEAYEVHRLDVGDEAVELLTKHGTATPSLIRYFRSGKLLLAWRYDLYQQGLADNPKLFDPVPGTRYEEQSGR